MKLQPIGWQSTLLVLAVCLIRGGNQVSLKFGLTALPPFSTAYWRMLAGVFTVGAWGLFRRRTLAPDRTEWRSLVQLSVLFFIQIALMHYGADLTSPAYAVILMNSNPVFANLMAHFVLPEDRLSPARLLGLAAAFAGVAVVALGRPEMDLAPNPRLGNLIILASAVLVALRTVYTQRVVQRIEPTKTVFWQMLLSVPCFGAAALSTAEQGRGPVSAPAVLGVLYQGVMVSGLAFILWVTLLRRHSPGALTVFSFTVPVFGVLFSAMFFGEQVTPRLLLGVLAVTGGIGLATQGARKVIAGAEEGDSP